MAARRKKTKGARARGKSGAHPMTASPVTDAAPSRVPTALEVPGPNGLSRALADRLVDARQRMPRRFAATSCGVSPKTFERWIQIGASSNDDPICVQLARRIFEVEGHDVGEAISDLRILRKMSATTSDS